MKKYLVTIAYEDETLRKIVNKDFLKLLRECKVSVSDVDSGYYSKSVSFNKVAFVEEITDNEINTLKNNDVLDDETNLSVTYKDFNLLECEDWETSTRKEVLSAFGL